jgi:isopenicillin N synthase-like dioxygenase
MGDMHEGFEFGSEDASVTGKNVWPDEDMPSLKEAATAVYNASVALGKKMFPLFAIALGLEPDFFDAKTGKSAALMRLLHYPPQTGPVDDRIIGIGAHTE